MTLVVLGIVIFSVWVSSTLSTVAMEVYVHSPWRSLDMDYLAGLTSAVFITLVLFLWSLGKKERVALTIIWIIKATVVLGPMLFYEAHYSFLDAFGYYKNAKLMEIKISDMGWPTGNGVPIFLLKGIYEIFPSSYHLAKVLFAFLGLMGVYFIYRGGVRLWGYASLAPLFILELFPGVLFWSSILGKEPLMIFSIGLYIYGISLFLNNSNGRWIVPAFLIVTCGVVCATTIRVWMAFILFIPLGVLAVFRFRVHLVTRCALLAMACLMGSLFLPYGIRLMGINAEGLVDQIDRYSKYWAIGGSAQEVPEFNSYGDLIRFAPLGMFTALFRPLPGEVANIFGMLASVENILLLLLFCFFIFQFRIKVLKDPLFIVVVTLVFSWAFLYGFVSYQNLGTAVRFKANILPVVLLLLLFPWWARMSRKKKVMLVLEKDNKQFKF